jgi:aminoglycoside/choline kinase family phosphotransferase
MKQRLSKLISWVSEQTTASQQQLTQNLHLLAGDASFRCYYRVMLNDKPYVIMDAPPNLEPVLPFIKIDHSLLALGLRVPKILAQNIEQGFLLLEDFGDQILLNMLNINNVEHLYTLAMQQMLLMHTCQGINDYQIGSYDSAMYSLEMSRFVEWFLQQFLQLSLTKQQSSMLNTLFEQLIHSALQQPQVFVHRDFHSRNLLLLPKEQIGVIDFQDAVWGAITYDAVSLLRDCYINWPEQQVTLWALQFKQLAWSEFNFEPVADHKFLQWFDWMGLERHLKCLYIFARKFCRDSHAGYLADIPRTMHYILLVSKKYAELLPLYQFMTEVVQPKLNNRLKEL